MSSEPRPKLAEPKPFSGVLSQDKHRLQLTRPRALSATQWRQPLSRILYEEVKPRLADTAKEVSLEKAVSRFSWPRPTMEFLLYLL